MDDLSIQGLQALAASDPRSLDLALLDPLRQQMQAAGDNAPPELSAAVDALVAEQVSRLNILAKELEEDWQRAVKAKQPIEDRWIDDERQFKGEDRLDGSKAYPADAADSSKTGPQQIQIHATRSKTLNCAARLADMLLPANDFPMRVDPPDELSPEEVQRYAQAMPPPQPGPDGQPQPPPDPKSAAQAACKQAAEKMQQKVFQLLRDCKFQAEARKAIFDCARIGVGILKGPYPTTKYKRTFGPDGSLNIEELPKAEFCRVDPWRFYYDMTPSLRQSSATYEVQILSKRELAEFKRYPRTIASTIDELLKEEDPKLEGAFRTSVTKRNLHTDLREPVDDVYAVLETHKVIDPKRLRDCLGIEWEHEDMPLLHLWSCNGKCIKFKLTPLERDFRVDYYNFTIMQADDTIFGYGYPYLARASQRGLNGGVRAMLANAAAGVAPIMLVSQGKVQPNREQWRMTGLNVFSVENQGQPLEQFFASVNVPTNVEGNLQMVKFFLDMMDDDTLFRQIMEDGGANREQMPASGMVMAANIANIFQKMIAAYADDNAFEPICERAMWWIKLYQPDETTGFDMVPKAIASTQLVAKDLALQHLQILMNVSSNPKYAGFSDPYEEFSAFVALIDGLNNKDAIVLPRDKAMANQAAIQQQQQQGDPNKLAELQSKERIAQMQMVAEQQNLALRIQGDITVEQYRMKVALIEAATSRELDMAALAVEADKAARSDDTQRFKAVLDAKMSATQQVMAEQNKPSDPHSRFD